MNIVVIGKGKMGKPLARLAADAGHQVEVVSQDPARPVLPAVKNADLVILATPYAAALTLLEDPAMASALADKVVIDITNPLAANYMSLTVGHSSSAAEEIAKRLPQTKIVKAFNTVFADVLALRVSGHKVNATVFVAGDDEVAKNDVIKLVDSFGMDVIDSGPLSNARYLEPMTEQLIQLAYGQKIGTKISMALVTENRH